MTAIVEQLLPAIRRAGDMAAALSIPDNLVCSSFVEATAAEEPYLIRCASNANKIILYLHTWSGGYHQITTMPEFLGIDRACIIAPNFNGPNNNSSALGTDESIDKIDLVLQEVMSKTGLSRIYIIAASGGTLAAMNYMGRYPGKVHRASLWLPIYDLVELYNTTSDVSLKADMLSAIGHGPVNSEDPDYFARSARSRLTSTYGPTTIFINVGLQDTTSIPKHGVDAFNTLKVIEGINVVYKEWNIGHVFGADQRYQTIKQLVLE